MNNEVFYDEVGREFAGTPQEAPRCNACGHEFTDPLGHYAREGAGAGFIPDGMVDPLTIALAQWQEHVANGCEVRTVSPTGTVTIRKPAGRSAR